MVADQISVPTNSRGTFLVEQLKVGGKICRPVKASVFAAANHWISSGLDEDTAQEKRCETQKGRVKTRVTSSSF